MTRPKKDVDTRWRYVSRHNDSVGRGGSECVIVDRHWVGLYPYTIEFADGKRLVAVERELQPLEASV